MVDLLAGLRDVSRKGTGDKFAISFRVTEGLFINPDEKAFGLPVAQAIAERIKANLLAGKGPDGTSMPGLDADTVAWRQREAELGARGGQADPRYQDSTFRAKVSRNYTRDYSSKKLGSFTPRAGGPRGVVSGMLASSFFVRLNRDGTGFTVYVAARRGRPRKGETKSALETVFHGVPMWNQRAMSQPDVRAAMQKAAQGMLGQSASQLLAELAKTIRIAKATLETAADE